MAICGGGLKGNLPAEKPLKERRLGAVKVSSLLKMADRPRLFRNEIGGHFQMAPQAFAGPFTSSIVMPAPQVRNTSDWTGSVHG